MVSFFGAREPLAAAKRMAVWLARARARVRLRCLRVLGSGPVTRPLTHTDSHRPWGFARGVRDVPNPPATLQRPCVSPFGPSQPCPPGASIAFCCPASPPPRRHFAAWASASPQRTVRRGQRQHWAHRPGGGGGGGNGCTGIGCRGSGHRGWGMAAPGHAARGHSAVPSAPAAAAARGSRGINVTRVSHAQLALWDPPPRPVAWACPPLSARFLPN